MHDYYEIRESLGACWDRPIVHVEIKDVHALPYALRRLAEQGHDMTSCLEVLKEACEEQRKRKALDAAIKDMTKAVEEKL